MRTSAKPTMNLAGGLAAARSLIMLALWLVIITLPAVARGQLAEGNSRLEPPASQLNQPFENPIFLAGHFTVGGGFQDQPGDIGFGGALIYRPGSPVNIFDGLMNWKTGMVIQLDYLQIPDGGDITSADLIMRRYFNNRGDRRTEVNLFLGIGTGVSRIDRPEPGDVAAGDHWSLLAEVGQEWFFKPTHMIFLKGQYRWMINAGRTYQVWSVLVGLGIAWP